MTSRFAWLRINAYGLLLAGLLLLAASDVLPVTGSLVAQVVARTPILFGVSGVLLIYGFVRARSTPELAGLACMVVGVVVSDVVKATGPGLAAKDVAVGLLVLAVVALRISALTSPDGLTVHIPGRHGSPPRECA